MGADPLLYVMRLVTYYCCNERKTAGSWQIQYHIWIEVVVDTITSWKRLTRGGCILCVINADRFTSLITRQATTHVTVYLPTLCPVLLDVSITALAFVTKEKTSNKPSKN